MGKHLAELIERQYFDNNVTLDIYHHGRHHFTIGVGGSRCVGLTIEQTNAETQTLEDHELRGISRWELFLVGLRVCAVSVGLWRDK